MTILMENGDVFLCKLLESTYDLQQSVALKYISHETVSLPMGMKNLLYRR
jgi:hypothetical protein